MLPDLQQFLTIYQFKDEFLSQLKLTFTLGDCCSALHDGTERIRSSFLNRVDLDTFWHEKHNTEKLPYFTILSDDLLGLFSDILLMYLLIHHNKVQFLPCILQWKVISHHLNGFDQLPSDWLHGGIALTLRRPWFESQQGPCCVNVLSCMWVFSVSSGFKKH